MVVDGTVSLLQSALPSDYQVVRPLKAGGQGSVFLAHHEGAEVALKVLRPDAESTRMSREIALLRTLACPYIVRVLDSFQLSLENTECQLVVYEFHNGGDLRDQLETGPGMGVRDLLRVGHEVGQAVDVLWKRRVVHRDIKPENIVQASDGRYVLVDFGLARHLDLSSYTLQGLVAGTVGYMSPEQVAGRRNLTVRSDLFSLGVTLYELAAARHPFGGSQAQSGSAPPPGLETLRPDLPTDACSLIDKSLALAPSQRPTTVSSAFNIFLEE